MYCNMLISLLTFISVEILYNKSNKKYGGNDMSIVQLYDITQIKSFIEHSNYESASYLYKLPQQYNEIDVLITRLSITGVFFIKIKRIQYQSNHIVFCIP